MVAEETPLAGGRLTEGVVRVGMTVRRPRQPSSAFVEKLLHHLECRRFCGAPRYLGRDADGRDMLTYLPGQVPPKWQRWSDDQVRSVGRLLRLLHDATVGSSLAGNAPVICHNDAGPHNTVFDGDRPFAFIDFDLARPGTRVFDLAYTAWAWCVSSKEERGSITIQAAQVRTLADGYGLAQRDRLRLPDVMLERQQKNLDLWRARRVDADHCERQRIDEVLAWTERELRFTRDHMEELLHALTSTPTLLARGR
jgi:hypothetical protein